MCSSLYGYNCSYWLIMYANKQLKRCTSWPSWWACMCTDCFREIGELQSSRAGTDSELWFKYTLTGQMLWCDRAPFTQALLPAWINPFEHCFVFRASTGRAAKQTDRKLPRFSLQTAGGSVSIKLRSVFTCNCCDKEASHNNGHMVSSKWLTLLLFYVLFLKNDIEDCMEWGSAVYYPQLARLKGNPGDYSWERAARAVSHNTHCHWATCFACFPPTACLEWRTFHTVHRTARQSGSSFHKVCEVCKNDAHSTHQIQHWCKYADWDHR